jgi:hypothetical protein
MRSDPPRPRALARHGAIAAALALAACDPDGQSHGPEPADGPAGRAATFSCAPSGDASDPFADCVDELVAEGGVTFGHDALPDIVLGPPMGKGEHMGSMHVASLGCGGSITLAFDGPPIPDGPGPDLVIFENAFVAGEQQFIEPGQVLVSEDGIDWYAFDCDAASSEGCAGIAPVLATDAATAIDPTRGGGDAFDLQALGIAAIRWVRIVDRTREHYGDDIWCAGAAGGFDLDAVARVEPG